MKLLQTGLLNSIAVGARILTSLGLNKVLAVYVGPSGYATIGQFQNFVSIVTTFASGAVNIGVTKYTAQYFDDEARQITIWKTACLLALIGSTILGLFISIFYKPLANWILKDDTISTVFIFLGVGLVFFTLNALLLAIINGKKEINLYVVVNIAGSLLGLVITGYLAASFGLYGALVALTINQSVIFFVTLLFCLKRNWFQIRNFFFGFNPSIFLLLGKFSLMALTSAACVPVSQMIIRNYLGINFGWQAAGHWEALMRISGIYLMIITTPLSVYYLPRLSEIRNNLELRNEIICGYRLILPVVASGAITIYLLRDWLVRTLFTTEFSPIVDLFAWQMIGDTMKIGSFIVAYLMLAKAMVKIYIITEIFFTASWICLVWLFTGWHGVQGAQEAYCINYTLYWTVMATVIFKKIR